MLTFRPHILNWKTVPGEAIQDPITGYPISPEDAISDGDMYFGATGSIPIDTTGLTRVSPVREYIFHTGNSGRFFNVLIKAGVPIVSILDLDAGVFGDITSGYEFKGNMEIDSVAYNLYTMELATPYSSSHSHKITFSSQFSKSVECHWHLGGTKEFRNEDNTVSKQLGRIRLDVGSELPEVGQMVEIEEHFKGIVRDIYKGQLSWRIDV